MCAFACRRAWCRFLGCTRSGRWCVTSITECTGHDLSTPHGPPVSCALTAMETDTPHNTVTKASGCFSRAALWWALESLAAFYAPNCLVLRVVVEAGGLADLFFFHLHLNFPVFDSDFITLFSLSCRGSSLPVANARSQLRRCAFFSNLIRGPGNGSPNSLLSCIIAYTCKLTVWEFAQPSLATLCYWFMCFKFDVLDQKLFGLYLEWQSERTMNTFDCRWSGCKREKALTLGDKVTVTVQLTYKL